MQAFIMTPGELSAIDPRGLDSPPNAPHTERSIRVDQKAVCFRSRARKRLLAIIPLDEDQPRRDPNCASFIRLLHTADVVAVA